MKNFDYQIKNFLSDNMYNHASVLKKTKRGKLIIKLLFNKIKNNPRRFIKKNTLKNQSKERCICDFIAGMTDRYAINLYNSLK